MKDEINDNKPVLLIGINSRYSQSNPSLLYLRSPVEAEGYSPVIKEYTIKQEPGLIATEAASLSPSAVCFSVYIWNRDIAGQAIRMLRSALPGLPIVVGGPEAGFTDEAASLFPEATYIIQGAGEAALEELGRSRFTLTDKLIRRPNAHFRQIPFPYRDSDFPKLSGKYIYYESSRGCPCRCAYCLSSRSDQQLEFRDTTDVFREIDFLVSKGPRLIKFVDRTFNADPERAALIWDYIISRYCTSGTSFHFEIRASLLRDEDFSLLEKAPPGLFQFEAGIQSLNTAVLKAVHRAGDTEKTLNSVSRLVRAGNIHLHVDLIAGLPLEDIASYGSGFNRVYATGAEHIQSGILKCLPGTLMRESATSFGIRYSQEPPYPVTSTTVLTEDDMASLVRFSSTLDLLYNSGRFKTFTGGILPFFASPFEMYMSIAEWLNKHNDSGMNIREAESLGRALLIYAQSINPDAAFLRDCLRWDWGLSSGRNRYPDYLQGAHLRKLKRDCYRSLSTPQKKESPLPQGIDRASLKRSLLFTPEPGSTFSDTFMDGHRAAIFTGRNSFVLFDPDNDDA